MSKVEKQVESLIKKPIEEQGYDLYDVEYVKEGKDFYLRIYIEKICDESNLNNVITLNDCEKVNDIVNPILDEADIIKEQYYLEVSSTGIEKNLRKFEHYEKAINKEIQIKLFKKDEKGNKEIKGILKKISPHEITIEEFGKNVNVDISNIAQAKTIYNWEEK